MVAHSTLGGQRRGQPPARPQTAEQTIAALQARIEQLEQARPQQPANVKLRIAPPNKFSGDPNGQQVLRWLAQLNTVFDAEEYNGRPLRDGGKVIIASSYLDDTPRAQFDARVEQNGPFATYDEFKNWIRQLYSPVFLQVSQSVIRLESVPN
jgi:hypothetical protein